MLIKRSDESISWARVAELFQAVGWGRREPSAIQTAFARSNFKAFAFVDDELVGFSRTIDDGLFYAAVVDVVVHPGHQRKGIGKAMLQDLQRQFEGLLVVTLTASPEVQGFYERLGWRKQTTAMMRPRSKEQARLNCETES